MNQKQLKELLWYDAPTGVFRWRKSVNYKTQPWKIAGSRDKDGYTRIRINNKDYQAHRLVWLYATGSFPAFQIDHVNGVKDDNRFSNLREVTNKQNGENKKVTSLNSSGYRGVVFHKKANKWQSQVKHNGKMIYLGLHDSVEQAFETVCKKRAKLFTHDTGRQA